MAFSDILALASQDTKEDTEKRKRALAKLDEDEKKSAADDLTGVLGLEKQKGVQLSPAAQDEADQQRVLADDRTKRYQRQRQAVIDTIPSDDQKLTDWLGDDGATLARETQQQRADELAVDPRGRAARLQQARDELSAKFGQTAPPPSGDASRSISVGRGAHGELYFTNLSPDELKAEQQNKESLQPLDIEQHPPDVTDLRPYTPGAMGGVSNLGGDASGTRQDRARQALLRSLDLEINAAQHAKLTPQEQASELIKHEPLQYENFATNGYQRGKMNLRQGVADGSIPPEIGGHIESKMDALYNKAIEQDVAGGDPADDYFKQIIDAQRGGNPPYMKDLAASGHPGAAVTTQQDVAHASAANMASAATGPGMERGTGDVARQRAVMPTGEGPGEPEGDADADDLGFLGQDEGAANLVARQALLARLGIR